MPRTSAKVKAKQEAEKFIRIFILGLFLVLVMYLYIV